MDMDIDGVPGFMAFGNEGLFACVAATRSGLTPWAAGWLSGACWEGCAGVVVPPVGRGVEKFDGISEVKIVADGDKMNF